MIRKLRFVVPVGLLLHLSSAVPGAEEKSEAGKKRDSIKISDEQERALSAANVVRAMVGRPETSIPELPLQHFACLQFVKA